MGVVARAFVREGRSRVRRWGCTRSVLRPDGIGESGVVQGWWDRRNAAGAGPSSVPRCQYFFTVAVGWWDEGSSCRRRREGFASKDAIVHRRFVTGASSGCGVSRNTGPNGRGEAQRPLPMRRGGRDRVGRDQPHFPLRGGGRRKRRRRPCRER